MVPHCHSAAVLRCHMVPKCHSAAVLVPNFGNTRSHRLTGADDGVRNYIFLKYFLLYPLIPHYYTKGHLPHSHIDYFTGCWLNHPPLRIGECTQKVNMKSVEVIHFREGFIRAKFICLHFAGFYIWESEISRFSEFYFCLPPKKNHVCDDLHYLSKNSACLN